MATAISSFSARDTGCGMRVPAVDRAFDLLELMARTSRGFTLTDVTRKLGLPKSSAHYLINTLLTRGYLYRDNDGRHYIPGPGLSGFATIEAADSKLSLIAMPYLRELQAKLNLTAQFAVLKGAEGVVIAKVDSPADDGRGIWVGRHMDLHCTALGKALICHFSEEELERLFRYRGFARYTPNTICSMKDLAEELARTRERGYSVNDEEHTLGVLAVAAPVFNHIARVVASVSVRWSAAHPVSLGQMQRAASEITATAREISRHLM